MKTFVSFLLAISAAGTTIDTSPATTSTGTFGAAGFGTPLYGWSFTVPVAVTQLDSVKFWMNGQQALSYTASICSFTGTACAGAALWSSGSLTGTGTGNLDPVLVSPTLGVTSGQNLLFYLSAAGGQGTGRLGVNGNGSDANGNAFWFQNGTSPQSPWTGGFLDGSPVAATETFSAPSGGGGGGCNNLVACDGGGGQTPEPATALLMAVGLAVGLLILRRK